MRVRGRVRVRVGAWRGVRGAGECERVLVRVHEGVRVREAAERVKAQHQ